MLQWRSIRAPSTNSSTKLGLTACGDPGVQKVSDVRMDEPGQDLALALEALGTCPAQQRQVQQLDRDGAVVTAVFTPRPPHTAATTLTQRHLQHVGAKALAPTRLASVWTSAPVPGVGVGVGPGVCQKPIRMRSARLIQQRGQFLGQSRVLLAQRGQPNLLCGR